jgi:hypothetical protein
VLYSLALLFDCNYLLENCLKNELLGGQAKVEHGMFYGMLAEKNGWLSIYSIGNLLAGSN